MVLQKYQIDVPNVESSTIFYGPFLQTILKCR